MRCRKSLATSMKRQSKTWPLPPERATYSVNLRLLQQKPKNRPTSSSALNGFRPLAPQARSNIATLARSFSSASIFPVTFEKPCTGGGNGPTNAICLLFCVTRRALFDHDLPGTLMPADGVVHMRRDIVPTTDDKIHDRQSNSDRSRYIGQPIL